MVSQTAQPPAELKPWETEPVAGRDSSVVPPDRVYVFYPEGENAYVNIPGRGLVQFMNSRLTSDGDRLSVDHLRWLGQQKRNDKSDKYLFCLGDPRRDPGLIVELNQRFLKVASTTAVAADLLNIAGDIEFRVQKAINVPGEEVDASRFRRSVDQMEAIHRLLPGSFDAVDARMEVDRLQAQEVDAEVIAQAAAGRADDTPVPEPEVGTTSTGTTWPGNEPS